MYVFTFPMSEMLWNPHLYTSYDNRRQGLSRLVMGLPKLLGKMPADWRQKEQPWHHAIGNTSQNSAMWANTVWLTDLPLHHQGWECGSCCALSWILWHGHESASNMSLFPTTCCCIPFALNGLFPSLEMGMCPRYRCWRQTCSNLSANWGTYHYGYSSLLSLTVEYSCKDILNNYYSLLLRWLHFSGNSYKRVLWGFISYCLRGTIYLYSELLCICLEEKNTCL